jgi:hypothetical protein
VIAAVPFGITDRTEGARDYRALRSRNPGSLTPVTAMLRGHVAPPQGAAPDVPAALPDLGEGRLSLHLDGIAHRPR